MDRDDIHIMTRHLHLTEATVAKALNENIYHNKATWQKFLQLIFISLGIGFTMAGIIFFFAYNWADLTKFTKIGLTEGLLIVTTCLLFFKKINRNIKNGILTGASILVGVLFVVFGQIYQTGANTYDFFLVWTVFISLWVFVSDFAVLWLVYLVLINTTIILYANQVTSNWSEVMVYSILFILAAAVQVITFILSRNNIPKWFNQLLGLVAVSYATIGIVTGIFEKFQWVFLLLMLLSTTCYALAIWHAFKTKTSFYLSIISFSLIIIVSALFIKISESYAMFFVVSLFIISSVTYTIKFLIDIQKKWTNEK